MPRIFVLRFGVWILFVAAMWWGAGSVSAACRMTSPDTIISGITLTESESARRVVGSTAELIDDDHDLPHVRFVSTNGAEELVLFLPYGADPEAYAEAEVRIAGTEALTLPDLPIRSFSTGRGVSLGMTDKEVESLFGRCVKSRQKDGNDLFVEYEIPDADNDPELGRFGYPVYYAEYEFQRGKLVRFRFGFAYP